MLAAEIPCLPYLGLSAAELSTGLQSLGLSIRCPYFSLQENRKAVVLRVDDIGTVFDKGILKLSVKLLWEKE